MSDLYTFRWALDYLNETNISDKIKESISSLIRKIKQGIINLISKIQKFLEKCKDSKIKSSINGILTKAKAALGDAEALEKLDEEKQEQQRNAVNKLAEEIRSLTITCKIVSNPETFYETIHLGDIKDYIKQKLDDNKNYIAFVGYEKDVINEYQKRTKLDIIKNHKPDDHVISCMILDKENFEFISYRKWGYVEIDDKLKSLLDSKGGSIFIEK